jgi:hypothetical protein
MAIDLGFQVNEPDEATAWPPGMGPEPSWWKETAERRNNRTAPIPDGHAYYNFVCSEWDALARSTDEGFDPEHEYARLSDRDLHRASYFLAARASELTRLHAELAKEIGQRHGARRVSR